MIALDIGVYLKKTFCLSLRQRTRKLNLSLCTLLAELTQRGQDKKQRKPSAFSAKWRKTGNPIFPQSVNKVSG